MYRIEVILVHIAKLKDGAEESRIRTGARRKDLSEPRTLA